MANDDALRLGRRMAALREERGFSQAELGRRAFVSRSYIAHLETGRNFPSWEVLGDIAAALGVTREDLTGRDELPPSPERQALEIVERLARGAAGVPVLHQGWVPANISRWRVEESGGANTVDVPAVWLAGRDPGELFIVQASGDCLHRAGIVTGSSVLCERAHGRRPADGAVAVVRIGHEITMKRWFSTTTGAELRDSDDNVAAVIGPGDDVEVLGTAIRTWTDLESRRG